MAHYTTTDIAVLAYKTGIAKDFRYWDHLTESGWIWNTKCKVVPVITVASDTFWSSINDYF